ncbi:hypothetical protein AVEN_260683-1 [Araneus ventricosus]|uniref:Uncharacterized protein n=1 Tax=Araneus ventricosus TaxID=182803 RepID=A0A4Y2NAE9_ARAVE|nr:hypothetical protein AVEN_260683-1 [Araneus ventricosus]
MLIDYDLLRSASVIDPTCRQHSLSLKLLKELPQFVQNLLSSQEKESYDLGVHKFHSDTSLNFSGEESIIKCIHLANFLTLGFKADVVGNLSILLSSKMNKEDGAVRSPYEVHEQSLAVRVVKTTGLGSGMSEVRIRGCLRTLFLQPREQVHLRKV